MANHAVISIMMQLKMELDNTRERMKQAYRQSSGDARFDRYTRLLEEMIPKVEEWKDRIGGA